MTKPPGVLAGHELLAELGRGGMGVVYRARHLPTGAERAVKLLVAAASPEVIERFHREVQALAKVAGEGVVPVHETGVERGRPFVVMALLRGGTLRERLRARPRWPWPEAAQLVAGLARTLERCHAAGIVHRDLKPENVLFDEEGRAYVSDFGCVRDLGAASLTETGSAIGTPAYMAPEQLDGKKVDAKADVYALGAMLHELVSGEAPLVGRSDFETLKRRASERPPLLSPHGAPASLDALVARALAATPAERPSAAALAAAIATLDAKKPAAQWPAILFLLVAALVALALLASHGQHAGTPPAPPPSTPPALLPSTPLVRRPAPPDPIALVRAALDARGTLGADERRLLEAVAAASAETRASLAERAERRILAESRMEALRVETPAKIAERCAAADAALAVFHAARPDAPVPAEYTTALGWIAPTHRERAWKYDARLRHALARATALAPGADFLRMGLLTVVRARPASADDEAELLVDLEAAFNATKDPALAFMLGRALVTSWIRGGSPANAQRGAATLLQFVELAGDDPAFDADVVLAYADRALVVDVLNDKPHDALSELTMPAKRRGDRDVVTLDTNPRNSFQRGLLHARILLRLGRPGDASRQLRYADSQVNEPKIAAFATELDQIPKPEQKRRDEIADDVLDVLFSERGGARRRAR